jgi:hypothetical protein
VVIDLRLHGLVLLDQVLDADQVFTPVGGGYDWGLFSYPRLESE